MAPQTTCTSALPGKTGKHENCSFHSNVVLTYLLAQEENNNIASSLSSTAVTHSVVASLVTCLIIINWRS